MDLIPVLSSVIVLATIATIILALLSYLAFKLRDRRSRSSVPQEVRFFRRFVPEGLEAAAAEREASRE